MSSGVFGIKGICPSSVCSKRKANGILSFDEERGREAKALGTRLMSQRNSWADCPGLFRECSRRLFSKRESTIKLSVVSQHGSCSSEGSRIATVSGGISGSSFGGENWGSEVQRFVPKSTVMELLSEAKKSINSNLP